MIPTHQRPRQGDHEFEGNLGYIRRPIYDSVCVGGVKYKYKALSSPWYLHMCASVFDLIFDIILNRKLDLMLCQCQSTQFLLPEPVNELLLLCSPECNILNQDCGNIKQC